MPTYEFACTECGSRFELFLRAGEEPASACEVCGGALRKIFSPVGVVLKGSGFYSTDSRAKPAAGKKEAKSEKEPAKKESTAPGKDAPKKESPSDKTPKEKSA